MCSRREPNPRSSALEYPALTIRPFQHKKPFQKKSNFKKKFGIFAEQNRKWKIPAFLPNYFSGQKGEQEKYLNMVVKKNPA